GHHVNQAVVLHAAHGVPALHDFARLVGVAAQLRRVFQVVPQHQFAGDVVGVAAFTDAAALHERLGGEVDAVDGVFERRPGAGCADAHVARRRAFPVGVVLAVGGLADDVLVVAYLDVRNGGVHVGVAGAAAP